MRIAPPLSRPTLPLALLAALGLAASPLAAQTSVQLSVSAAQPGNQTPIQSQSGPSDDSADAPASLDHLNAVVVSSHDGRPVPRVLVTSPDRRMAAMTDSEGRFSFDLRRTAQPSAPQIFSIYPPSPAAPTSTITVQFMVRKPGYLSDNIVLRLPAASPGTVEPTLQLKITPAAVLTGHVYAESGDLPPNLTVQLRRRQVQDGAAMWMQAGGSQVNSRGEFRIANLQPGDYKLMTSSQILGQGGQSPLALARAKTDSTTGLLPAFYPGADSLDSATVIHIGPGETATANLTARAATFYHVAIPVAGNDPSKGLGVNLLPDSAGFNLAFNFQSHEIEGYLPAGSYTARVTWFGTPPAATIVHFQVTAAPVQAPPVHLASSADLPITVHRDFTGKATQPDSQGPFVVVNVQSADSNGTSAGLSPAKPGEGDEGLRIQNLSEGLYRVVVSPRVGYVASVTSGTTDLLLDPLAVSAAGSAAPIVVTLRDDYATLNIQVPPAPPSDRATAQIGDTGQVFLLVIPLDRPQTQSFVVNWPPNGQNQYTLPSQPPGRYLVLASRNRNALSNIEYRNPDVLRDLMSKGATVTLSPGGKSDVQVPLLPEDAN